MNILILSTETTHHKFYIYQLSRHYKNITVIFESNKSFNELSTKHHFEIARDNYESQIWSKELQIPINNLCNNFYSVTNINNLEVLEILKNKYDVCIIFGTRKIISPILENLPNLTFNLHGGDPQIFRGLDSHLWALWHNNISGLKVCMHKLSKELDKGDIFRMDPLDISRIDYLYQLRALTTESCIQLSLSLLRNISQNIKIQFIPQINVGKYFSLIPFTYKDKCIQNFKNIKKNNYEI